ncbi:MAG: hypothetical protein QOE09_3272 [Ilumatobacteraceae bacterium]|jgi:hypothetical protein
MSTRLLPNGDVTTTIDDDTAPSVVGDFNDWHQHSDPYVEELDGRKHVTVSVPAR